MYIETCCLFLLLCFGTKWMQCYSVCRPYASCCSHLKHLSGGRSACSACERDICLKTSSKADISQSSTMSLLCIDTFHTSHHICTINDHHILIYAYSHTCIHTPSSMLIHVDSTCTSVGEASRNHQTCLQSGAWRAHVWTCPAPTWKWPWHFGCITHLSSDQNHCDFQLCTSSIIPYITDPTGVLVTAHLTFMLCFRFHSAETREAVCWERRLSKNT